VYFEISAAPFMYSFGDGVFLNEIIEIIGAENILAGQDSWLSVAEESVLDADPDVILTSVNYIDDPVGEIKSRAGWQTITAVANGDVYYIDADASNRPNQNIVKALHEIALAVYPDKY
jgi:iron complex transport system substrate-binding protein